ncbi:MAG TPA: UbiH/UbiF/VisC/COQ6 family ubiquinone biosynthesis hydroxylase [Gammaproteobacteria bacterium]|nr:UbiH/UbiF/VisC/COQ6 family ubiquinone biosynthesis hydroxylase [Gammaproteobacteria bacterium]
MTLNNHLIKTYDIIIVGGGVVGLTLACALAQRTSLTIAILESESQLAVWSSSQSYVRVSAITLVSQRIFQALGVWEDIQNKRVSPFKKIHVWDAKECSEIDFNCEEISESVLGFIIENNLIQSVLEQKIKQYSSITLYLPILLNELIEEENGIKLIATNEEMFNTKLLVAADGAHSWARQHANIAVDQYDYQQQAIVATVETSLPHQLTARQVFLETGPLAFLPLNEPNKLSIVWSLPIAEAKHYVSVDEEIFNYSLSRAFEYKLGDVKLLSKRYLFPLSKQQAQQYVKSHIALVGDAAHVIHPLAGQGINMGLLDAASLLDVIVDALNKNRCFSSYSTLRYYERWRKADNVAMQVGIDIIKHLFASHHQPVQVLRSSGLKIINQVACIKNIFTRYAVGHRGELPTLMQSFLR